MDNVFVYRFFFKVFFKTFLYYRVCKVEVAADRLGAVYRENYVEYCALALGAVHFNASVHCFDIQFHNGQSHTGAYGHRVVRRLVEWFEDVPEHFRTHSLALVADR